MACICSKSYGYSIEKCMQMEVIISARKLGEVPEMMADLNPFAKLQYLRLRDLPKLKIVYWNESPFPHVREIIVSECPILKKLSLGFNNAKESKIVIYYMFISNFCFPLWLNFTIYMLLYGEILASIISFLILFSH